MSESVKKIAPLPIPVDVMKTEGQPPQKEHIVKLTEIGFLMKVDAQHFYKVGEDYLLRFQLPVINVLIQTPGKIIKVYSNVREHLVEVHFRTLGERERAALGGFLKKISHSHG